MDGRDGVGFLQQLLRFGGAAQFHFHAAQCGDAGGAGFGEALGQLFLRWDLLLALGVGFAPLGNPDVLAHGLHALAGVAFGVFQEHVAGQQLVGDAIGGAAAIGRGDDDVAFGCRLVLAGGVGVHRFGRLANALLLSGGIFWMRVLKICGSAADSVEAFREIRLELFERGDLLFGIGDLVGIGVRFLIGGVSRTGGLASSPAGGLGVWTGGGVVCAPAEDRASAK